MGSPRDIAGDLGERGLRIAGALGACIVFFGAMGAAYAELGSPASFDLSGETHLSQGLVSGLDFPALFSGVVLFVAAGLALSVAVRLEYLPWALLGAGLAFMGIDELIAIHEKLEGSTGIDWQLLYLPVLALLGPSWLSALRRVWDQQSERTLWLGAAAAWIVAQLLEFVANDVPVAGLAGEMAWLEELLEMAGSSMLLLTLYLVLRRAKGQSALGRHHPGAEDTVELGA
jgi:hypothetical protein